MHLLVFEYSSIYYDNTLLSEGFNMLKSILNDLAEDDNINVDYLLNSKLSIDINKFNCITVDNNLISWLKCNSYIYDYCIFIAPEDDYIQYNISKILEENDVKIIGSTSHASYICTSKIRTYENLKDIKKIPTYKIDLNSNDDLNYEKIGEFISKYHTCIIKPDNMTSSDYIYKIHSIDELIIKLEIYEKNNIKTILLQEYIDGKSCSVSIINTHTYFNVICINSQEIIDENNKILYHGCKTPIDHPLKNEIIEISKNITSQISGLYGFFGIDYIIKDNMVYLVEINSRFTTPFIVLSDIASENLTCSIIDGVLNDNLNQINLENNSGTFTKN
ncbi:ATP-grasp domain-containing protein [uncultured Methanosphaera sp.]|uniref:ATP-grasp domain-containing protein n=1 Tax=uncultured Methanosphaera sp. TaxID=262501 RepID=UPI002806414F|nr:ATP-grasp domain-containing protein [uncultured Methanosphaera sp.]